MQKSLLFFFIEKYKNKTESPDGEKNHGKKRFKKNILFQSSFYSFYIEKSSFTFILLIHVIVNSLYLDNAPRKPHKFTETSRRPVGET